MQDLEAEMARALEGKFFWEYTAREEPVTSGDSYKIRVAQSKFYSPKTKTPQELREEELAKLNEVVLRRKGGIVQYNSVNVLDPEALKSFATDLASVVADVYGVNVQAIAGSTRGNRAVFAKHHYPWAMIRYFPLVPLRRIAAAIGKDRGTLYHSDEVFTMRQHEFGDKIAAVDAVVGYS